MQLAMVLLGSALWSSEIGSLHTAKCLGHPWAAEVEKCWILAGIFDGLCGIEMKQTEWSLGKSQKQPLSQTQHGLCPTSCL